MKEEILNLLKTFGYEVKEQGSYTSTEEYPDNFFTIWNDDTQPLDHYDNEEVGTVWVFIIYFYSKSPLLTVEMIKKAKALLKKNGWIVPGKGRDAYSDSKDHCGRMIKATYSEKN